MEKKREGDREAAGEVFLASDPLYHCFFGIGDGKGELLKFTLSLPFPRLFTNGFLFKHSSVLLWKMYMLLSAAVFLMLFFRCKIHKWKI
jgi:hypothetical protein